jgi:DDE superfamily endonuclease
VVEQFAGRVVLHFLPPYCPQANRIERVWLDVHANVTRNHTCRSMLALMRRVHAYLTERMALCGMASAEDNHAATPGEEASPAQRGPVERRRGLLPA